MKDYQEQFIDFCIKNEVIRFGEFTLKSGRISPYFFNAGLFNSGKTIAQLGKFYAAAINNARIDFDVLFGPAYKGIPLVVSTVIALSEVYDIDKPYCFNRKVVKDHGEGGNLVGAPLKGKVLIIDDVITAGTSVNESVTIIRESNAELKGVCIALDRQEKGQGEQSAISEIEKTYGIRVISIITLQDLIDYTKKSASLSAYLEKIQAYRKRYGTQLNVDPAIDCQ